MSFLSELQDGISRGFSDASGPDRKGVSRDTHPSGGTDSELRDSPNDALVTTYAETAEIEPDGSVQMQVEAPANPIYIKSLRIEETSGRPVNVSLRVADNRPNSAEMKANPLRKFTDDTSGPGSPVLTLEGNDMEIPLLMKMQNPQVLLITASAPASNTDVTRVTAVVPAHSRAFTMGVV